MFISKSLSAGYLQFFSDQTKLKYFLVPNEIHFNPLPRSVFSIHRALRAVFVDPLYFNATSNFSVVLVEHGFGIN